MNHQRHAANGHDRGRNENRREHPPPVRPGPPQDVDDKQRGKGYHDDDGQHVAVKRQKSAGARRYPPSRVTRPPGVPTGGRASAAPGATMSGFHRTVEALIDDGLTAMSRPAMWPASAPPTVLPSHQVAATPAIPMTATVTSAATGLASVRNAAGASSQKNPTPWWAAPNELAGPSSGTSPSGTEFSITSRWPPWSSSHSPRAARPMKRSATAKAMIAAKISASRPAGVTAADQTTNYPVRHPIHICVSIGGPRVYLLLPVLQRRSNAIQVCDFGCSGIPGYKVAA